MLSLCEQYNYYTLMFDMIGGEGVEVGVLGHCMGRMELEGGDGVIQLHLGDTI